MKRVFISYARENAQQVRGLAADISELGHEVWFDAALTGGQAWWDQILVRIRDCDVFVFALSRESLDSEACNREWRYAHDLGKIILPVLILGDVSIDLLPPHLSEIQCVDYQEATKQAIIRLTKALSLVPPPRPLPDPLPSPPEVPKSYLGSLREQVQESRVLSFQEQSALLLSIKQGLRDAKNRDEILRLLKVFRSRPELLTRVSDEVDQLLEDRATSDLSLSNTGQQAQPLDAVVAPKARDAAPQHDKAAANLMTPPQDNAAKRPSEQAPVEATASHPAAELALEQSPAGGADEVPGPMGQAAHPEDAEPVAAVTSQAKPWKTSRWLVAGGVAIAVIIFLALPASVVDVYIPGYQKEVMVGQKIEIYPELRYNSDWRWGKEYAGQTAFDWSSSNTAVASVSLGTVTGVAPGNAVIRARYGDYSDSITIVVQPRQWDVPAMKATFKEVKFYAGKKYQDYKDRAYKTEFDIRSGDNIYAEFTFGIDQAAQERELAARFSYVLYRPDGSVAEDYTFTVKVERAWPGAIAPVLLAFEMAPGQYRLELKHEGKVIGRGGFVLK